MVDPESTETAVVEAEVMAMRWNLAGMDETSWSFGGLILRTVRRPRTTEDEISVAFPFGVREPGEVKQPRRMQLPALPRGDVDPTDEYDRLFLSECVEAGKVFKGRWREGKREGRQVDLAVDELVPSVSSVHVRHELTLILELGSLSGLSRVVISAVVPLTASEWKPCLEQEAFAELE